MWHWVDYTPATQVRRRLRASSQRELIETELNWNIDNLSDSSCSTIIPGSDNLCFWAEIKNNVFSCKPQFYYIKVGFKGVNIIKACFCDVLTGRSRFDVVLKECLLERYKLLHIISWYTCFISVIPQYLVMISELLSHWMQDQGQLWRTSYYNLSALYVNHLK